MLQQQAQQQVLIRFVAVRDQKRQVPLEVPPIIERMLALPELRLVEIQPRCQFAVQILDQFPKIRRMLQFAAEQAVRKLMQFRRIDTVLPRTIPWTAG